MNMMPGLFLRWRMLIGLLSDTHGFLADPVFRHFAECDEIWHVGDFGTVEALDRLRVFRPVRGVYGNVDGAELRADLPEDFVWECEAVSVCMTNIGGYPGNDDRRGGKATPAGVAGPVHLRPLSDVLRRTCIKRPSEPFLAFDRKRR